MLHSLSPGVFMITSRPLSLAKVNPREFLPSQRSPCQDRCGLWEKLILDRWTAWIDFLEICP